MTLTCQSRQLECCHQIEIDPPDQVRINYDLYHFTIGLALPCTPYEANIICQEKMLVTIKKGGDNKYHFSQTKKHPLSIMEEIRL